ncbi:MAG: PDZ domain-containing protein [Acidobacteria bacterium]|nr:PDZ domain-containing protein [Acidobacteriota bacterium]
MDLESALPPLPPRRRSRWWVPAYVLATAAALTGVGSAVHLPDYSIGPGPARDVGRMVRIDGRAPKRSSGSFLLTTVSVSERTVTVLEGLRAWLDPSVSLISRDAILTPGLDDEQQALMNVEAIEESKYAAEVVALRALDMEVPRIPGAFVLSVIPDSPAAASLKSGDVIVAVDGHAINVPEQLSKAIGTRRVGQTVRLTVDRAGTRRRFTLRTVDSVIDKGRPSVGIFVREAFRLPVQISIDTGDIGGPSGGLVFALAIAGAVGHEDLTRGHRIAATGTISLDGTVGAVGGVRDKIAAARHVGADVFVLPAGEVALARPVARGIRLIGIRTFAEAVAALRRLPAARPAGSSRTRP